MKGVKVNSSVTVEKLDSTNLKKPITVPVTDRLSVRLYEDSRPRCMETAPLHKGLVLVLDNNEVVEEGMVLESQLLNIMTKLTFPAQQMCQFKKTIQQTL